MTFFHYQIHFSVLLPKDVMTFPQSLGVLRTYTASGESKADALAIPKKVAGKLADMILLNSLAAYSTATTTSTLSTTAAPQINHPHPPGAATAVLTGAFCKDASLG